MEFYENEYVSILLGTLERVSLFVSEKAYIYI